MVVQVCHSLPDDLFDQVLARFEVVVNCRCLTLGAVGDIAQASSGETFAAQNVRRGIQDPGSGLGGLGSR